MAMSYQVADISPPHPEQSPPPPPPPPEELHEGTAHAAKPGLPQLDTTTFASQIFWLVISFAILYVVMSALALPRLQKVLKDRADRIRQDIDAAAKAKRQSDEAIAAYTQSLAEARAKALKIGDDMRKKMQAQIDDRAKSEGDRLAGDVARAEARIQTLRGQALTQVGAIATEAATAIVERLGGQAQTAQVQDAVAAALKQSTSS